MTLEECKNCEISIGDIVEINYSGKEEVEIISFYGDDHPSDDRDSPRFKTFTEAMRYENYGIVCEARNSPYTEYDIEWISKLVKKRLSELVF